MGSWTTKSKLRKTVLHVCPTCTRIISIILFWYSSGNGDQTLFCNANDRKECPKPIGVAQSPIAILVTCFHASLRGVEDTRILAPRSAPPSTLRKRKHNSIEQLFKVKEISQMKKMKEVLRKLSGTTKADTFLHRSNRLPRFFVRHKKSLCVGCSKSLTLHPIKLLWAIGRLT